MKRRPLNMGYYDAHIHFFYDCSLDELRQKIGLLEKVGLAGINILVISEFPGERETYLNMIPGAYHSHVTREALENQKDPFAVFSLPPHLKMVPFLDARFMEDHIEEKIKMYRKRGFKGLKLLYVPEEDRTLNIGGMEKTFGRTCKQSEKITSSIIEQASFHGMPILMHVDLRRYGNFVEEMIKSHPRTHFNIPHFGFSRKAMSLLLDKYPNCYTDMSSLISFMEKEPAAYKSFIQQYQDRVLFGSDAVIGEPETVLSALQFMKRFLEDMEIFDKLSNKNYKSYMAHGSSS
ncbi:MAG: amidohydrolase family protein [Thermodesulfobacteriota bacterium]|nr:amidohydrolase family protein [Thermodesulfobacteriota bacterium]